MYTIKHFIWLGICFSLIIGSLIWMKRKRLPIEKLLSFCCVACIFSELTKVFGTISFVPSTDGSMMYPYLEMSSLPLHLCSIQIINIYYCRFSKNEKIKETILAFMYPSCTIGAFLALMIPTIFTSDVTFREAFLRAHPYEYFLYHAMLVVLGIYILISGQVNLKPRHYLTSLGILAVLAFVSLYANSMFASATYENGTLISVDYVPNLFFTYAPPIDIKLTQMWHWYVYLGIILGLAVGLITLFYIPVFRKARKSKQAQLV